MDGTFDRVPPILPDAQPNAADNVRLFPDGDPAFRADVMAAIAMLMVDGGFPAPHQLEDTLRYDYPGIRVVEQSALGTLGERPHLYCFRDGSVRAQLGDGPGTPRFVPLAVAVQRESARSLVIRQRSAVVVASAVEALERSRGNRLARAAI